MIVADSSVWIAHFRNEKTRELDLLTAAVNRRAVLVGDLILAEVLQGFASEARFKQTLAALEGLPLETIGGRDIAVAAARNYQTLHANGIMPRGTIDVLIATFCIENGHTFLHADKDFDAMVEPLGLEVL